MEILSGESVKKGIVQKMSTYSIAQLDKNFTQKCSILFGFFILHILNS